MSKLKSLKRHGGDFWSPVTGHDLPEVSSSINSRCSLQRSPAKPSATVKLQLLLDSTTSIVVWKSLVQQDILAGKKYGWNDEADYAMGFYVNQVKMRRLCKFWNMLTKLPCQRIQRVQVIKTCLFTVASSSFIWGKGRCRSQPGQSHHVFLHSCTRSLDLQTFGRPRQRFAASRMMRANFPRPKTLEQTLSHDLLQVSGILEGPKNHPQ